MRPLGRYSLAIAAGVLSGLAWGVTFALFQPSWVEASPNGIGAAFALTPITVTALCSRYLVWWTGVVQALFGAGLLCSWVIFDWYNLHMAAEFINWRGPITKWTLGTAFLTAIWAIARTMRREWIEQHS